jgi:D-serine dehydratase
MGVCPSAPQQKFLHHCLLVEESNGPRMLMHVHNGRYEAVSSLPGESSTHSPAMLLGHCEMGF